jgi:hypothetical protein
VGYRCARSESAGGVRLDSEHLGEKLIVHNYGHGGAGAALAWSCAVRVAQLVAGARRRESSWRDDRTVVGLLARLAESAVGPGQSVGPSSRLPE